MPRRKPHGTIFIDGREVAMTLQCCHCGGHFLSDPGSGVVRGFCFGCMQVTCGALRCHECVPIEKKLDLFEAGKISSI